MKQKQTRSFIRVREIHFFEAHTAHANEEDATQQIQQDLEIVDRLMEKLCLPIIKAKRPVWDTFPEPTTPSESMQLCQTVEHCR